MPPVPNAISIDFNNADLLQRLTDNGVSFLLVGGAAVAFYGCRADRHLPAVDILIDPAIENANRVMAVLSAAGLTISAQELAGLTVAGEAATIDMDILTPAGTKPFLARAVEGTVNGNNVRVIGLAYLIAMKRSAASDADTGKAQTRFGLPRL
jgi:predicted nucleotidyltransferase